jgi:hypothetical protein
VLQMVNEAEFAAMKAAKKAAKAAKAAGTTGEAKKQQRSEERKKRKAGGESSEAAASSGTATAPPGDGGAPADDSSSAAYAVVNAAAARGPLHDKTISCVDCATDFVFSVEEHGQRWPLGSTPARPMCLLRARLVALGSSALAERGRPTRRPAPASGARAAPPPKPPMSSPPLTLQVAEQEFFLSQGYMNGKSRCKECTRAKTARFGEATDAASRRLERDAARGKT